MVLVLFRISSFKTNSNFKLYTMLTIIQSFKNALIETYSALKWSFAKSA